MNIGQFKNASGQLVGSIATATIDLPRLGLRPVESNNERAPVFEIVTLNVARRWVQIGALWQLTSHSTGEVFYQGKLDDPSLSEPLQITLFGNNEEGFRVVWNRAQPRRENMDGTRQSRRKAADDGFGNGNATDNGQLAEPQNDEIPAF
ncbi:DUF736 domain-containing protein [Sphingomonas aerolata]|uniref:DUF736 domain-containing protein n=1 Tax=Sphingomonas aerolata TaxID=185951 RepID=UPI0033464E7B